MFTPRYQIHINPCFPLLITSFTWVLYRTCYDSTRATLLSTLRKVINLRLYSLSASNIPHFEC